MIPLQDMHVHTTYCDGNNTPVEMAEEAFKLGIRTLGFSRHSYPDEDGADDTRLRMYLDEIEKLKQHFAGKMRILTGIELDVIHRKPAYAFDYVIGSVHYVQKDDHVLQIDMCREEFLAAAQNFFDGDVLSMAEAYYQAVGNVVEITDCDIIGHFDLIAKFNENDSLFDSCHPRYLRAWKTAANRLLASGRLFEINTGAISRGYRTIPYPSPEIYAYLKAEGARFVFGSDSHSVQMLRDSCGYPLPECVTADTDLFQI